MMTQQIFSRIEVVPNVLLEAHGSHTTWLRHFQAVLLDM